MDNGPVDHRAHLELAGEFHIGHGNGAIGTAGDGRNHPRVIEGRGISLLLQRKFAVIDTPGHVIHQHECHIDALGAVRDHRRRDQQEDKWQQDLARALAHIEQWLDLPKEQRSAG